MDNVVDTGGGAFRINSVSLAKPREISHLESANFHRFSNMSLELTLFPPPNPHSFTRHPNPPKLSELQAVHIRLTV